MVSVGFVVPHTPLRVVQGSLPRDLRSKDLAQGLDKKQRLALT